MKLKLPGWLREAELEHGPLIKPVELLRQGIILMLVIVLLIGSALMVIWSAHQYRLFFNQQQELVQQWDELQVEWGQLLLEQGALAANSRVESVAIKRLEMIVPEQVEVIRDER